MRPTNIYDLINDLIENEPMDKSDPKLQAAMREIEATMHKYAVVGAVFLHAEQVSGARLHMVSGMKLAAPWTCFEYGDNIKVRPEATPDQKLNSYEVLMLLDRAFTRARATIEMIRQWKTLGSSKRKERPRKKC